MEDLVDKVRATLEGMNPAMIRAIGESKVCTVVHGPDETPLMDEEDGKDGKLLMVFPYDKNRVSKFIKEYDKEFPGELVPPIRIITMKGVDSCRYLLKKGFAGAVYFSANEVFPIYKDFVQTLVDICEKPKRNCRQLSLVIWLQEHLKGTKYDLAI